MSNLETVQKIYAAFGRGDIPSILENLAEDVEWEKWDGNYGQDAGVPWLRHIKGRSNVGEFFAAAASLEIHRFEVMDLLEGGNKVAAIAVGSRYFDEEEMHLWTFNDKGEVTAFRHYADTAKHIEAAKSMAG